MPFDDVLSGRESFALIVCGGITLVIMLAIPYIFNWGKKDK